LRGLLLRGRENKRTGGERGEEGKVKGEGRGYEVEQERFGPCKIFGVAPPMPRIQLPEDVFG